MLAYVEIVTLYYFKHLYPLVKERPAQCTYKTRVGYCVLLRSERIILLRSFKAHKVLLRFFPSFWQLMKPKRTMSFFAFFS